MVLRERYHGDLRPRQMAHWGRKIRIFDMSSEKATIVVALSGLHHRIFTG
jgi:hypothetical protein